MCSGRRNIDSDCVRRRIAKECLRNEQRSFEVLLNGFEELVTVRTPHGILGANHRRVANQNVDFSVANKLREGRVHFALLRDISGGHKYLDVSEFVLDGGFGVEKGLFPTAKEGDPRRACFGVRLPLEAW